jgi:hypothetical protein
LSNIDSSLLSFPRPVFSLMQASNIFSGEIARPTVVQGSSAPIMRGGGSDDFACRHCGHTLAQDYNKRSLIAVDIECFRCRKISRTEQWPDGESLPQHLIRLTAGKRYIIGSTVLGHGGVAFSCDYEIDRVRALTSAALEVPSKLNLSPHDLDLLEDELNILTEYEFAKMVAAAKRARGVGNIAFTKCPPAWAMEHLRSRLSEDPWVVSREDEIAIGYLYQLRHIIARWQHHHFFPLVAKSLCSEFRHAVTMLLAASHLSDVGNEIGITNTLASVGRSPDLYLNVGAEHRISIEVKAPNSFFWPLPQLSLADLEKQIHRVLRSAREQLTGEGGGIVVLGVGFGDEYKAVFAKAVENVASSGKMSTRIAAIFGVHQFSSIKSSHDGLLNCDIEVTFCLAKNPRYPGVNPVID